MRAVKQKHPTGCGVAAVAMAAGVKYDDAMRAVHPNHQQKRVFGCKWNDVRRGLRKFGIKHEPLRRLKVNMNALAFAAKTTKTACIVGVAEKTRVKDWHYLVISKTGKVYDPYYGKSVDPAIYPVVRSFLELK
jgi:hypothetical protein